jgi:transposase
LCDAAGRPVSAVLAAGQRAEVRSLIGLLLAGAALLVRWPARLACDRGFSAGWVRSLLRLCGMKAVIPFRSNEHGSKKRGGGYDRRAYRGRNVIERLVGWLKERRRIATRYEKLAVNYRAMVHIAFILHYLKHP